MSKNISGLSEIAELYQPQNLNDRKIVNELLEKLGAVPLKIYNNQDIQGAWQRYSLSGDVRRNQLNV